VLTYAISFADNLHRLLHVSTR